MVDSCPFEGTVIDQRFELGDRLGQGSLGRVFECRDRKQGGRRLALKLIRPDVMNSSSANFLKHEFRVLSHLDHPNIAQVFEFGRIPGRKELYFTEELVEGYNFVKVLRRAPISVFLDVFAQFLRALGYAHSKGVLHSDIKPKNVYITARRDGRLRVKLIDFHLCREGTVFTDRLIRGTISYMAPEMIRGDPIDFRSDLYGAGIMAYEALARERPIVANSPLEVLRAHLDHTPTPLAELREDLPQTLCSLIDRLLLKDPNARPSSTREILKILNEELDQTVRLETRETRRAYLRNGVLVSRGPILQRIRGEVEGVGEHPNFASLDPDQPGLRSQEKLWDWLATLDDGQSLYSLDSANFSGGLPEWEEGTRGTGASAVLVIEGEEGIGKTRLLEEARIECQLAGVPFFRARAGRVGSRPLGSFLVLLRSLIERLNLGELLSELAPDGCLDPLRLLARHQEKGEQGGIVDALVSLFAELSEVLPFVAAIDDFAEADSASFDLAHRLAVHPHRALYLLACSDSSGREPWQDLSSVRLGRLEVMDVQSLLSSMLGEEVGAGFAAQVYAVTGGNPRFTEETLRHLAEDGALTTEEGALSAQLGSLLHVYAPSSVQQVLKARIGRLSDSQNHVIGALALSLRGRPADFISAVTKIPRNEVEDMFEVFEEQGWIRSQADLWGRDLYWIIQSPLRRLLAASLDSKVFETFQDRIATFLESRHPAAESFWSLSGDPDWVHDRAEELAYHFALSGNPELAFKHSLAAAEVARTGTQRSRIRRLYSLTVELSKGYGEEHGTARRMAQYRIAEACSYLGRYSEALERFERLRTGDPGHLWERCSVLFHCARLRLRLGQFQKGYKETQQGLALAYEGFEGSEKLQARLLVEQAAASMWLGQGRQAIEAAKQAIVKMQAAGLEQETFVASHLSALGHRFLGEKGAVGKRPRAMNSWLESLCVPEIDCQETNVATESEEHRRLDKALVEAIALELASGNREEAALTLNIRGNLRRGQGKFQQAFEDYERAVMLCEELENVPGSSLARTNVGHLFIEVGDFENGEASLELASEAAEYCGLHWLQGFIGVSLARAARLTGDDDAWGKHLSAATQAFQNSDFQLGHFEIALERIDAFLTQDNDAKARELLNALVEGPVESETKDQHLRLKLFETELCLRSPEQDETLLQDQLAKFDRALADHHFLEWRVTGHLTRARIFERMGDKEAQGDALQQLRLAFESIGQELSPTLRRCYLNDSRRQQLLFYFDKKDSESLTGP
jgi:serine/threonine protein kinase/tetratricopeptide (TPR) repeat protein